MTKYKGVSVHQIADSITEAKRFVYELGVSDFIKEHINQISADDIESIRNAPSAEEAARILTDISGTFLYTANLFQTHGALDTNGKGAQVAHALNSWGAMSGVRALARYQIDAEVDQHLEEYPTPTDNQVEVFRKNFPEPYIQRYGIKFDMKEAGRDAYNELLEKISTALEPFYEIDEVGKSGYGAIVMNYDSPDQSVIGVLFETSYEGAIAVASHLSDGYAVITSSGNIVEPPNSNLPSVDRKMPRNNL